MVRQYPLCLKDTCYLTKTHKEAKCVAKNTGSNYRIGAVKDRSQTKSPVTRLFTKREVDTGRFIDVKQDGSKFKGIRNEK
jgi:hypothetical protein